MMKKLQKIILVIFFVLLTFLVQNSFAGSTPSYSPEPIRAIGGRTGASCPSHSNGGLFILLGLGAAYAGKKLYDKRKELPEEQ